MDFVSRCLRGKFFTDEIWPKKYMCKIVQSGATLALGAAKTPSLTSSLL